jgi:diguanylate cyclase (GGDEF)-like protein/PAS domain S-box-containing protein
VGRDGEIQYVSPSVQHLLGVTPDEVTGAGTFVHPEDRRPLAAHFARVIAERGFHGPIEVRARHRDGTWRWLEVRSTNQLDNPAVRGVVLNARDVTERRDVEDQLAHQALHDTLTELPNRGLMTDRLGQALSRAARLGTKVGVLFVDLDRFKLVNDTRGHDVGDQLLIAVGERLASVTRHGDTIARFGGDEFVIVYEDVRTVNELLRFADRLCRAVADPYDVDGGELYASISVGVAIGGASATADSLLRDADAAMYHAKEQGGGTVTVFDESIRRRARSRLETERALHAGLERSEFALEYQPIFSLADGTISGVEALLRWDTPEHGTILPGEFVELAEETRLIIPIEHQVRALACRQLQRWHQVPAAHDLSLSLNASATQLREAVAFASAIEATLVATGIEPSSLTLEITESFLMEDTEACLDGLAALKALGVNLAVDDFGTRYSSLGYLNRMSLDGLKIDRDFVSRIGPDEGDSAIVAAIVTMAHSLGLWVVAEGVETAAQCTVLTDLGCEFAQGYFFSRPLRPAAMTEMLDSRDRVPRGQSRGRMGVDYSRIGSGPSTNRGSS